MSEKEHTFPGGVVNAGSVVRVGDKVFRPAGPHTPVIHAFLRHLQGRGFTCAPHPLDIRDGKECLSFIEGSAAHYPYPEWCLGDEALSKVARAMRQFHDAARGFDFPKDAEFNYNLADPLGGPIIGHNDISLENTVFKEGEVVGFLDFDFAAPGRPLWDIARAVILWVPIDNPDLAHSYGFGGRDPYKRLKLFCDCYGMQRSDRLQLVDLIDQVGVKSEAYVKGEVDAGKPAFIELWNKHDLAGIYRRRRQWLHENADALTEYISS
ncbi:MAG TPA: phosphotransferase [Planktothrix sp.]